MPTVLYMLIKPEPCQRMASAFCHLYVDKPGPCQRMVSAYCFMYVDYAEPCQRMKMVSAYCFLYVDKARTMPENGKCIVFDVCSR